MLVGLGLDYTLDKTDSFAHERKLRLLLKKQNLLTLMTLFRAICGKRLDITNYCGKVSDVRCENVTAGFYQHLLT